MTCDINSLLNDACVAIDLLSDDDIYAIIDDIFNQSYNLSFHPHTNMLLTPNSPSWKHLSPSERKLAYNLKYQKEHKIQHQKSCMRYYYNNREKILARKRKVVKKSPGRPRKYSPEYYQ